MLLFILGLIAGIIILMLLWAIIYVGSRNDKK